MRQRAFSSKSPSVRRYARLLDEPTPGLLLCRVHAATFSFDIARAVSRADADQRRLSAARDTRASGQRHTDRPSWAPVGPGGEPPRFGADARPARAAGEAGPAPFVSG